LPDGSLEVVEVGLPQRLQQPASYNGGGGLYSTGPDYVRFLRMLLGGGQLDETRVLRPETVAEMARNQIGGLLGNRPKLCSGLPWQLRRQHIFIDDRVDRARTPIS